LKQEESQSASAGFKLPAAKLTLTADAYIVTIKDRVVLTDQFSDQVEPCWNSCCSIKRLFDSANATAVLQMQSILSLKVLTLLPKLRRKRVIKKTDLSELSPQKE
jgi:hypothetical protein